MVNVGVNVRSERTQTGGLIFYFVHERHLPPFDYPPPIDRRPRRAQAAYGCMFTGCR
ncbi:hypothetical protein SAMN02990966_06463 [Rhodospirillales bacterium URHD0017]|nr:hypothetical protein SAMN02990966_06463 [Rhodospirillales bacterium URHD0017]